MSKVSVNIKIDKDVKESVAALFHDLGLDMTTAVNLFVRKCLSVDGLPFSVNRSRIDIAIAEADELLEDPSTKRYNNMKDLKRDLLA